MDLQEYVILYQQREEAEDVAIREAIEQEMFRIWYYYLSPAAKKQIVHNFGEQSFLNG